MALFLKCCVWDPQFWFYSCYVPRWLLLPLHDIVHQIIYDGIFGVPSSSDLSATFFCTEPGWLNSSAGEFEGGRRLLQVGLWISFLTGNDEWARRELSSCWPCSALFGGEIPYFHHFCSSRVGSVIGISHHDHPDKVSLAGNSHRSRSGSGRLFIFSSTVIH
jgi:hypothetical protein